MNLYEQWVQTADDIGLNVVENVPFESQARGLICGDCIGLNQDIETTAEKTCVLAEEVIHSQVNTGDILDVRNANKVKQEHTTRKMLRHSLADLRTIVYLVKSGYREMAEVAEKMGITESFLSETLSGYKEEYGISLQLDDDVLYFEPTIILESQIND